MIAFLSSRLGRMTRMLFVIQANATIACPWATSAQVISSSIKQLLTCLIGPTGDLCRSLLLQAVHRALPEKANRHVRQWKGLHAEEHTRSKPPMERFMDIVNERGRELSVGLSATQKLVAEMHEADQKSDGFRFPTDRGDAPFAFGDRGIDLTNLREVMQGLITFFECAYLDFSHQDDTASEAMEH